MTGHRHRSPLRIVLLLLLLLIRHVTSSDNAAAGSASSSGKDTATSDGVGKDNESNDDDHDPFEHFLMACSDGNQQVLEIMLEEYPDFSTGQSKQGESCLHAAAIYGRTSITQYVLNHGGNPNQRSTFAQGLRMTPLSWNVYGGHVDTARALLEAGADVNMDFDSSSSSSSSSAKKNGQPELITVLDVVYSNMPESIPNDSASPEAKAYYQKHVDMRDLLLQYGAKRYAELVVLDADAASSEEL
jgi:ankyrin repeat protein